LHYLANLTSEKLHETLEAHKNKLSTPVIQNKESDHMLNEEVPKAKKSAKKRKKEKRNKGQASLIKFNLNFYFRRQFCNFVFL
jgi:hypothetical protein